MAASLSLRDRLRGWFAPSELQLEQVERMTRTTPLTWGLALVGALLCHHAYVNEPAAHGLGVWLSTYASVIGARMLLWLAWLLHPRRQAWLPDMLLPVMASNLLLAAHWGVLSTLLRDSGQPLAEALLHVNMAIVAMSGATRLATLDRAAIVYTSLVIAPLAMRDVMLGGESHLAAALAVSLAGLYAVLTSRALSQALFDEHAQRRRNNELVLALRVENERSRAAQRAAEQANAARTRLFAAANHDLRQPLNAMALLAQTLGTLRAGPQTQDIAEQMIGCTGGMAEVVDDLLDIARSDAELASPEWTCFAIEDFVHARCRPHQAVAAAKGLHFEVSIPPATVRSDRALLARVLTNLLSNAIRYTAHGGVRIGGRIVGDQLQLTVTDSGIGIAPEHLPRIFEEFYQVDPSPRGQRQGFGLGLATVKRLCDLLGMDVGVRSACGEGSEFELRVPLATQPESTHPASEPVPARQSMLPARVLVVDDDDSSRSALEGLLSAWGMDVRSAGDPSQALATLQDGFSPGALVIDLRLGLGASGIELARALRVAAGDAGLPAVIVTGDVSGDQIDAARTAGFPVITKPVRQAQLRAFLAHAQAHARTPAMQ